MKKKDKKRGFTIIELLTVMSIIIILIAMLVPSLNAVRRFARVVTQKGQFHDISKGLEMFRIDFEDAYPDSSKNDLKDANDPYCGAMKLCEAMMGQDGLGFHPDSLFDDMGQDADGNDLYFNRIPLSPPPYTAAERANLQTRKVKYMEGSELQFAAVGELFHGQPTYDPNCAVICDVFRRTDLRNKKGQKLGMPILYYRADSTKYTNDPNTGVTNNTNIYNFNDNDQLVEIDIPWLVAGSKHPLYTGSPDLFYKNIRDKSVTTMNKPHNQNSFILLSAGWDGLYGTRDDVYNFTD
jgi:prepilin-type N-terminal cleavage/methylation domain-containing protein